MCWHPISVVCCSIHIIRARPSTPKKEGDVGKVGLCMRWDRSLQTSALVHSTHEMRPSLRNMKKYKEISWDYPQANVEASGSSCDVGMMRPLALPNKTQWLATATLKCLMMPHALCWPAPWSAQIQVTSPNHWRQQCENHECLLEGAWPKSLSSSCAAATVGQELLIGCRYMSNTESRVVLFTLLRSFESI